MHSTSSTYILQQLVRSIRANEVGGQSIHCRDRCAVAARAGGSMNSRPVMSYLCCSHHCCVVYVCLSTLLCLLSLARRQGAYTIDLDMAYSGRRRRRAERAERGGGSREKKHCSELHGVTGKCARRGWGEIGRVSEAERGATGER